MQAGEAHELQMDRKGRVRKPFSPMFLLGNILIIGGLAMLLGIGGGYAFQTYSNDQEHQAFQREGVTIDPTPDTLAGGVIVATPTAEPTTPPPHLSSGPNIADW